MGCKESNQTNETLEKGDNCFRLIDGVSYSLTLFQMIQKLEPGLVALHCQEVGGKNYEASMQHVNQFVK